MKDTLFVSALPAVSPTLPAASGEKATLKKFAADLQHSNRPIEETDTVNDGAVCRDSPPSQP